MRLIDADAIEYSIEGNDYQSTWNCTVNKTKIDAMPTIEPQSQWISVKDRLPENSRDVFVCYLYIDAYSYENRFQKAYCTGHYFSLSGFGVWGGDMQHPSHEVIAWMPIPEFEEG